MTDKQINKVIKPKMAFLFGTVILIAAAVLCYVLWDIRDKSIEKPKPMDFGTALIENDDEEKLYVDSNIYSVIPFAEDEKDNCYCFVLDDNDVFFIMKITDKTFKELEKEYDEEGENFQFYLKGYVNKITDEVKSFAIKEYNNIFETDGNDLTEYNFDIYVGNTMLDETIHPQDGWSNALVCIGAISWLGAFILLVVFIVNFIKFNIFRSKNDMELIRYELSKESTVAFPKLGAYLTDKYIFATGNTFLSMTNYNDILWMYTIRHSVNSIYINTSLVGRDQNGKQLVFAVAVKKNALDELAEEIVTHNTNMMIGYSTENIAKYKELTKK